MFYSRETDYADALQTAHDAFITRFRLIGTTKKAQELEDILKEIKVFSSKMASLPDNDDVYQDLKNQYFELITITTNLLNDRRGGKFSVSALFNRTHYNEKKGYGIKAVNANDIFEEELAALVSATDFLTTGDINLPDIYLFGKKNQSSRAVNYNLDNNLDNNVKETLESLAEHFGREYTSTSLGIRAGKIDVKGLSANLEITQDIPVKIERLAQLLKGASFTVKNYSSFKKDIEGNIRTKELSEIGISLGNSNLYKAITGAMSELGLGHQQLDNFFYRGANTMINNSHSYGATTQEHWAHMRLIYELRGSGLLDESGHVTKAEYIIWNDPNSENIAVASTATLLYNLLNNSIKRSNLFNDIRISAAQVSQGKKRITLDK